ncbi:MAG: hypothetical protein IVW55_03950 [Chloroflexi bacterium]|nr:hypothetical protein [Chloroflexota bacterium]
MVNKKRSGGPDASPVAARFRQTKRAAIPADSRAQGMPLSSPATSFSRKLPVRYEWLGGSHDAGLSWRHLYSDVLQRLAAAHPDRLRAVMTKPPSKITTKRGLFSNDSHHYIVAGKVGDGLFTEINGSAFTLARRLHRIFVAFDLDPAELVIYVVDSHAKPPSRHPEGR